MDELMRELDSLPDRMSGRIQNEALRSAAEPILKEAVDRAPEQTGRGKEAIKISRTRRSGTYRYVTVGINQRNKEDARSFYMAFHEFGTVKMPARPFLGPAYENNKRRAMDIIREQIRRGLGL